MTPGTFVLGVDVGSSGTQGVLIDERGAVVASASCLQAASHPAPGQVEHDAEADWWASFATVCRELTSGAGAQIAAVGVSGLGPCVLLTDAAGRPLHAAISYGVDTRAAAEIQELAQLAEGIGQTGIGITTQSPGPKLMWVRRHRSELWAEAQLAFSSHNWIVHRITGRYALDRSSASMWAPLYDERSDSWDLRLCEAVAPGIELPEVVSAQDVVGVTRADIVTDTGLPPGIPVIAGCIDYAAEIAGVGATDPGTCVVVYGSTLSVNLITDGPVHTPQVWSSPGARPDTHYVGGVTSSAGRLVEWLRDLCGTPDYAVLEQEARSIAPGSEGLLLLPYFSGERSPIFDPDARGVVAGLTLRHDRRHIYRAVLESIALSLRHILDELSGHGYFANELVCSGGGTRNGLLVEVASSVTNVPQRVVASGLGAPRGSALLAAEAIGLTIQTSLAAGRLVEPVAADRPVYDALYAEYRALDAATRPIVHRLGSLPSHLDLKEFSYDQVI